MPSDLWSFTLDFYARPGVEQACLDLQASGSNVCLLLCGAWLAQNKVTCNAERVQQIRLLATPWHDNVIQPLRQLRIQWRDSAQHDVQLGALREQVKAMELGAEHELLNRLEARAAQWLQDDEAKGEDWLSSLLGEGTAQRHDALQVLRVAMDQP
jgi:uncharacterized protein (TIGR02444 family)